MMITSPPLPPPSSVGFSFSPGGLLFPYHLGVITSLEYHGKISDSVHIAGASAGAIAVACHASRTNSAQALQAMDRMCQACSTQFNGRAVGNLLPLLKVEMDRVLDPDAHSIINERQGTVVLAHKELFPQNRNVLVTKFETRDDLIESVLDSCMFPFFSTPFPARLRYKSGERIPRVTVDGFFTVPRDRFGCPDFAQLNFDKRGGIISEFDEPPPVIERTISVACFPHEAFGMTAFDEFDRISPELDRDNPNGQISTLGRYATQPSSSKEIHSMFEQGWGDAEKWSFEEDRREKELIIVQTKEMRQK